MKHLILLLAALTLPTAAPAQALKADATAQLARELSYCGVFALNAPSLAQDRAAAEAQSKKAVGFVKVALLGLKVRNTEQLAQEAVADLNRGMNAARDNAATDPEGPVKFLNKTQDDCEKTLNSPAARKAYEAGVATLKASGPKRNAGPNTPDAGDAGAKQGTNPEAVPGTAPGK